MSDVSPIPEAVILAGLGLLLALALGTAGFSAYPKGAKIDAIRLTGKVVPKACLIRKDIFAGGNLSSWYSLLTSSNTLVSSDILWWNKTRVTAQ